MELIEQLLKRLTPPPEEWFKDLKEDKKEHRIVVGPLECTSFEQLTDVWKDTRHIPEGRKGALRWNDRYDIALSTMLAVAASTELPCSQVWLRVIAVAGSGKSTLCEAIAASEKYSFATSVFTGIHSGDNKDGKDKSLIPIINGKTFLINEGDTLMKQPNKDQLMSELRDLHFGIARCIYRNGKVNVYDNIRTTVILAGTPTIRSLNASALGDRFLDLVTYEKESNLVEGSLVRNVIGMGLDAILNFETAKVAMNGSPKKYLSPEKLMAYRLTAGYIEYLRENITTLLRKVKATLPPWYVPACEELGKVVAIMRTRSGKGEEEATEPELHTRLGEQLGKLGLCIAVVLDQPIGPEVMRRLATIAMDTCYGNTFKVCNVLAAEQLDVQGLTIKLRMDHSQIRKAVHTLRSIDAIRYDDSLAVSGAANRRKNVYRVSLQTGTLLSKLYKWVKP